MAGGLTSAGFSVPSAGLGLTAWSKGSVAAGGEALRGGETASAFPTNVEGNLSRKTMVKVRGSIILRGWYCFLRGFLTLSIDYIPI